MYVFFCFFFISKTKGPLYDADPLSREEKSKSDKGQQVPFAACASCSCTFVQKRKRENREALSF